VSPRTARVFAFLGPLAAALATACAVHVDGAPCSVPGTTADCPQDQACGNDHQCSARALACAASRCSPGATHCSPTRAATAVRCEVVDPVCGTWVEDDCAARGLECGMRGSGACECPEYVGTVVVADPGGSPSRDTVPFPRGQASPRECRFGSLADALVSLAATTVPGTVTIAGEPGVAAVFGAETGEAWPLLVPSNVTVRAAPAPAGPSTIRGGTDAASAGTLVRVLGALEGLRIEGGGARGVGVELACEQAGAPALRNVRVEGGGFLDPSFVMTAGLGTGVSVTATCGARLEGVEVTGVAGPALSVEASAGVVQVVGGTYGGSEIGIWLRGGRTSVSPNGSARVSVAGNAWAGIAMSGGSNGGLFGAGVAPAASIDGVDVAGNGGLGIIVSGLDPAGWSVALTRCDVSGNGRTRAFTIAQRQAGGVLISLGAVPATLSGFAGNRLWSNAGDQLVIESDSNSQIGPSQCGPGTNVFACMAPGAWGVRGVGTGTVYANNNRWPVLAGQAILDYIGGTVSLSGSTPCYGPPASGEPAIPACLP
jgi:hypothetical protein